MRSPSASSFSLFIYSFFSSGRAGDRQHHQHLPRDRSLAQRLRGHLRMPTERKPVNPGAADRPAVAGLRAVSFQHQSASSPAVSDIRSPPTGARRSPSSGVRRRQDDAGETSRRLYQPKSGTDSLQRHRRHRGRPRRTARADRLRHPGYPTFSGTIRENLLFVNPAATDEQCLSVLRRAACDNLLARAERGLDTV